MGALTPPFLESLFSTLEAAQGDAGVEAIVLAGQGGEVVSSSRLRSSSAAQPSDAHALPPPAATPAAGIFCAGMDVAIFRDPGLPALMARREEVVDAFHSLLEAGRMPTVAALQKAALGGACELALACNARVATAGAWAARAGRLALLPCAGNEPMHVLRESHPEFPCCPQAPGSACRRRGWAWCRALAGRSACRAWWACRGRWT